MIKVNTKALNDKDGINFDKDIVTTSADLIFVECNNNDPKSVHDAVEFKNCDYRLSYSFSKNNSEHLVFLKTSILSEIFGLSLLDIIPLKDRPYIDKYSLFRITLALLESET